MTTVSVSASAVTTCVGHVQPGYEPIRERFDSYLRADPAFSAQLAIYRRGELVVDLVGGQHLDVDSVTGVFSATKGVAAITLATLIDDAVLDLDERVAHYWPEFAAHGKDQITVRQLLSHQAGLVNIVGGLEPDDILLDSRRAAELLAAARPLWRPGSAFGYHGLTVGVFMEELVRRVTGETLQQLFERRIRAPRDIDFYLGLPEQQERRYRDVLPMQPPQEAQPAPAFAPDGYGALMVNSVNVVPDLISGPLSPNRREVRAVGAASVAGVGSARGLAAVYATALGYLGAPVLAPETIATMSQQQSFGMDRVLNDILAYAVVFQNPVSPRLDFGSYRAFGHDGAGGAIGCADPTYDLAIGYIPAPMQYPGGADPKGIELTQLARRVVASLDAR